MTEDEQHELATLLNEFQTAAIDYLSSLLGIGSIEGTGEPAAAAADKLATVLRKYLGDDPDNWSEDAITGLLGGMRG